MPSYIPHYSNGYVKRASALQTFIWLAVILGPVVCVGVFATGLQIALALHGAVPGGTLLFPAISALLSVLVLLGLLFYMYRRRLRIEASEQDGGPVHNSAEDVEMEGLRQLEQAERKARR